MVAVGCDMYQVLWLTRPKTVLNYIWNLAISSTLLINLSEFLLLGSLSSFR
jgi:hypothetical protein